jgi:Tfp pilus assembly major pilin PilA
MGTEVFYAVLGAGVKNYLDKLHPNEIAQAVVNSAGGEKEIYEKYISKQPKKRANEIRESIDGLTLRMRQA